MAIESNEVKNNGATAKASKSNVDANSTTEQAPAPTPASNESKAPMPKVNTNDSHIDIGINYFFMPDKVVNGKRAAISLLSTDVVKFNLNTSTLKLSDKQLTKLGASIGIIDNIFESLFSRIIRMTQGGAKVRCDIQHHVAGETYIHNGVERVHETDGYSLLPQLIVVSEATQREMVKHELATDYSRIPSSLLRKDDSEDY